jgi:hypothetical protein
MATGISNDGAGTLTVSNTGVYQLIFGISSQTAGLYTFEIFAGNPTPVALGNNYTFASPATATGFHGWSVIRSFTAGDKIQFVNTTSSSFSIQPAVTPNGGNGTFLCIIQIQ